MTIRFQGNFSVRFELCDSTRGSDGLKPQCRDVVLATSWLSERLERRRSLTAMISTESVQNS